MGDMGRRTVAFSVNGAEAVDAGVVLPVRVVPYVRLVHQGDSVSGRCFDAPPLQGQGPVLPPAFTPEGSVGFKPSPKVPSSTAMRNEATVEPSVFKFPTTASVQDSVMNGPRDLARQEQPTIAQENVLVWSRFAPSQGNTTDDGSTITKSTPSQTVLVALASAIWERDAHCVEFTIHAGKGSDITDDNDGDHMRLGLADFGNITLGEESAGPGWAFSPSFGCVFATHDLYADGHEGCAVMTGNLKKKTRKSVVKMYVNMESRTAKFSINGGELTDAGVNLPARVTPYVRLKFKGDKVSIREVPVPTVMLTGGPSVLEKKIENQAKLWDEVVANHTSFAEFSSAALQLMQEEQPSMLDRLFVTSRSALQAFRNAAKAADTSVPPAEHKERDEVVMRRLQGNTRLAIDARDALETLFAEVDRLRALPKQPKPARLATLDDLVQKAQAIAVSTARAKKAFRQSSQPHYVLPEMRALKTVAEVADEINKVRDFERLVWEDLMAQRKDLGEAWKTKAQILKRAAEDAASQALGSGTDLDRTWAALGELATVQNRAASFGELLEDVSCGNYISRLLEILVQLRPLILPQDMRGLHRQVQKELEELKLYAQGAGLTSF